MTKKDYQIIANVFKKKIDPIYKDYSRNTEWELLENLAIDMADALQADNTRFNKDTFLKACGL